MIPFREAITISRVYVIVEGPTEESFVSGPLAEVLWPRQVYVTPIILGVPGHKGGRTKYVRVEKDILKQLKQDQGSYCTTMIDYYGLGDGFPGTPVPSHLGNVRKVELRRARCQGRHLPTDTGVPARHSIHSLSLSS